MALVSALNMYSGGDDWVCDSNGIPIRRILNDTSSAMTITFPMPSTEYAYEPFVNAADGEPKPKYTSFVDDDANLTLTLTIPPVTQAQMGGAGGEECYVQMRIIK